MSTNINNGTSITTSFDKVGANNPATQNGGAKFGATLASQQSAGGQGYSTGFGSSTVMSAVSATARNNMGSTSSGQVAFGAGASALPGAGGLSAGGLGGGASVGMGGGAMGNSPIGSAAGGDSQGALLDATKQMQETQMSFNLQYLQLQSQMQHENRSYTAVSNIMKTKHDTVKNSISNVR